MFNLWPNRLKVNLIYQKSVNVYLPFSLVTEGPEVTSFVAHFCRLEQFVATRTVILWFWLVLGESVEEIPFEAVH